MGSAVDLNSTDVMRGIMMLSPLPGFLVLIVFIVLLSHVDSEFGTRPSDIKLIRDGIRERRGRRGRREGRPMQKLQAKQLF